MEGGPESEVTPTRNDPSRHHARLWWRDWRGAISSSTCPVCGLTYVRKVADDRKRHRTQHRKVLATYEPKPNASLAALYAKHGVFVPVAGRSLRSMRNRLGNMAVMFRRECGFDFVPYSVGDEKSEWGHHWLILTPDGRAIGGLSAWHREFMDAPPGWRWAWAWVIPAMRRNGHMQRCWDMLTARFSEIEPQPPLSRPAAQFFAGRSDVTERVREHAEHQLKHHNDG